MSVKPVLRKLFDKIDAREAELRKLRHAVNTLLPAFKAEEGLLVTPRIERIRDAVFKS